jgi:hypothetical protein
MKFRLAAFLIMFCAVAYAQTPSERIESLRVAFISEKLHLTPEEAQKFWPVYNNYRDEMSQLRRKYKVNEADPDDPNYVNNQMAFEQEKLNIKNKYRTQFESIIGTRKLAQLMSAEDEFKRKLIESVRERRQQGR